MTYKTISDLPEPVQEHLPKHVQEIYLEAFNNAWEQYADLDKRRDDASREEVAHRIAWTAVKQKYEKKNGHWARKSV